MAHVDRPGVNRYRPNRTGPSHSFPVVRGPSVGLGRTGGTAPGGDGGNFTGHGKILPGPTDRIRDRRPQTARVSADRNDPNQPAPLSLRRWAPAFASPSNRRFQTWRWTPRRLLQVPYVPGTRQSSPPDHIRGLQPCPRRRPCPPASGAKGPGWPDPSPWVPSPGPLPESNGRFPQTKRSRHRYPEIRLGTRTTDRETRPLPQVPRNPGLRGGPVRPLRRVPALRKTLRPAGCPTWRAPGGTGLPSITGGAKPRQADRAHDPGTPGDVPGVVRHHPEGGSDGQPGCRAVRRQLSHHLQDPPPVQARARSTVGTRIGERHRHQGRHGPPQQRGRVHGPR